ncbi:glycosyltransferase family 25 protein [Mycolicibacterium austroafricanum]|nr:glycosyltransferase family 25 protein [Mycolicibacterium austroafricanum]QZT69990.1 glycosyltransferase family 25 protein [Mycolicibacterium austroafricanum]
MTTDSATAQDRPSFHKLPTFIIGLPKTYRGAPLESALDQQDIKWSRVDGVVFNFCGDGGDRVDAKAARILLRREILSGEVGCALAHRNVYRMMVNQACPMAVVFEDDARLSRTLEVDLIQDLLHASEPRVLLLSYKPNTVVMRRQSLGHSHARGAYSQVWVPPTTTTAYALNLAAAELLLDDGRPISYVADWPVRPSPDIRFFVMNDPVASPDLHGVSTIGDRSPDTIESPRLRLKEANRRLLAISHVTWLRHRRLYGSYRAYIMHEFIRFPAFAIAARKKPTLRTLDARTSSDADV